MKTTAFSSLFFMAAFALNFLSCEASPVKPKPTLDEIKTALGIGDTNYTLYSKLHARGHVHYYCVRVNDTDATWFATGADASLEKIINKVHIPVGYYNSSYATGVWNITLPDDTSSFVGRRSNITTQFSGKKDVAWALFNKVSASINSTSDIFGPTRVILRVFTAGGLPNPKTRCNLRRLNRTRSFRYRAQYWLLKQPKLIA